MNKKTILFISLLILLILAGCYQRPISEKEKSLLFVVSDLEEFDIKYADLQTAETYKSKKYLNGSWEIKYTYDSRENIDATPLHLVSKVIFRKNEHRAKSIFPKLILAFKGGGMLGGLEIVEDSKLFEWGDQCYAAFKKKGETKVGNLILIRKGSRIFYLILSGLYFDDRELLEELLIPKLENMKNF